MTSLDFRPAVGALTLAATVLAAPAVSSGAGPHDRVYASARHGLRVEAPPGWELSSHTGYPSVLVLLLHPEGPRISVAAADTEAESVQKLAEENRRGLEAQELRVLRVDSGARGSVQVLAQAPARDQVVRQAYFLRNRSGSHRQAVVVTLTCAAARLSALAVPFDFVLKRLTFVEEKSD